MPDFGVECLFRLHDKLDVEFVFLACCFLNFCHLRGPIWNLLCFQTLTRKRNDLSSLSLKTWHEGIPNVSLRQLSTFPQFPELIKVSGQHFVGQLSALELGWRSVRQELPRNAIPPWTSLDSEFQLLLTATEIKWNDFSIVHFWGFPELISSIEWLFMSWVKSWIIKVHFGSFRVEWRECSKAGEVKDKILRTEQFRNITKAFVD